MNGNVFFAALLGALLGSAAVYSVVATSAEAQQRGRFRECVARTIGFDGDHRDLPREAERIDGWTPVGGSGSPGQGYAVILCR